MSKFDPNASAEKAVQGNAVGLIIPPKEIRAFVDRTATFVARSGPAFEERVRDRYLNKGDSASASKFDFILPTSPYYRYYKARVEHFQSGSDGAEEEEGEGKKEGGEGRGKGGEEGKDGVEKKPDGLVHDHRALVDSIARARRGIASLLHIEEGTEDGEARKEALELKFGGPKFVHPSHIKVSDMALIQQAARFTALAGRGFLERLVERESGNPRYAFLRPTHALFGYFQTLTNSYRAVYEPNQILLDRLRRDHAPHIPDLSVESTTPSTRLAQLGVLERSVLRAELSRAAAEREAGRRAGLASRSRVDFLRFTVVQVVDLESPEALRDAESWEAPKRFDELTGMAVGSYGDGGGPTGIADAREAPVVLPPVAKMEDEEEEGEEEEEEEEEDDDMEDDDDDMEDDDDDGSGKRKGGRGRVGGGGEVEDEEEEEVEVREDYVPRLRGDTGKEGVADTYIDPQTGKAVPLSNVDQHMRVALIDPKWREDQARAADKQRDTVLAQGDDVADTLRRMAAARADIFGSSAAVGTKRPRTDEEGKSGAASKARKTEK